MTRYQKGQLRKIFSTDCKLRGKYIDGRATCAIGALIVASTKKGDRLREIMSHNNRLPIDMLGNIASHIRKTFGIGIKQQGKIQSANDSIHGKRPDAVKARRRAVLRVLATFPTTK